MAQPCPTGNILLETQEQIDNFPVLYPDCSVIEGNLEITGEAFGAGNIFHLDSLYRITEIQGNLKIAYALELHSLHGLEGISSVGGRVYISFTALDSLTGLSNLQHVGADMQFGENSNLQSLHGLERLQQIGDGLGFWFCHSLGSLDGLDSLSQIGGYLILNSNYQLSSLEALNKLTSIPGYLELENLPALSSLNGLGAIESIGENLTVINNQNLQGLAGLSSLNSVGGAIIIRENPLIMHLDELSQIQSLGFGIDIDSNESLENISGLSSITRIGGGNISISSNPVLTDISGIANVDAATVYYIEITNNPSLSVCSFESTCDFLQNLLGPSNIALNADGCNSDAEVLYHCQFLGETSLSPKQDIEIYPVPVTDAAHIRFRLPYSGYVKMEIINSLGQVVTSLADQVLTAGEHSRVWHTGGIPAGLYTCRIQSGREVWLRKLLVIPG
ncbi:MAG: T9SS type A sorting domain-containing protein [Bacteroidales bacterium]|nr:T9SS type A sorting domain-containing protein [Bacteroidales bacterium]